MKRIKLVIVAAVMGSAVLVAAALASAASCSGGQACSMHGTSSKHEHGKDAGASSFLTSYFEIRTALAADKVKGLDKMSKNLAGETAKFRATLVAGSKEGVRPDQISALKDVEKAALAMKGKNITEARESFKSLSRTVLAYVKSYGCDGSVYSFYCDMAKESWLQETNKIGNPYYGSQMLTCGFMTGHTMNGMYMAGASGQQTDNTSAAHAGH
jgi:Cu(I)/Ag(I) efflux system membrane fusion protein